MALGVDYSYSRPDPACLRAAGYTFAVRYLHPTSSKSLDLAEARLLLAAGLDIVSNYEASTAGWMFDGYSRGQAAARDALAIATGCGMPAGRPIYYSLDVDPGPLTTAQWDAVKRCLDGAASVHGRASVGVYGGWKALEVLCPAWAPWGWQTYAWSAGRISARAHLRQYRNGVAMCGGDVDLNESYAADFGQWHPPTTILQEDPFMALSDAEQTEILKGARAVNAAIGAGQVSFPSTVAAILGACQQLVNTGNQLKGQQAALATALATTDDAAAALVIGWLVANPATAVLSAADKDDLVQRLLGVLPAGSAAVDPDVLLDALNARLAA
jgi:Domain of unknown function (DUF1906)